MKDSIINSIYIGFTIILICIIISAVISLLLEHYTEYYWETCEPWKDCPDCKSTGKIEINYDGSNDLIDCPCTQELKTRLVWR